MIQIKSRENILPNDVNVNEFVTQSIILDNLIEFYNFFGEEFKSEVFYLTSYERLKHNTKKEMKGIFEVLFEENPNINVLNKAVESCEFEKMQKKEIDHKIKNSRIGDNKNSDGHNSRKVRKGKIGGYRDELEKKTIREINYKLENELSSFYKTEYFHK